MKHLVKSEWPRIIQAAGGSQRILLFLDFDGTLTPISKYPDAVKLSGSMRRTLNELSILHRIVIISGRSLDDLKRRCKLKRVVYVGNHGMQISGLQIKRTAQWKNALRQTRCMPVLSRKLHELFCGFPGVLIENKLLTISIHYRNIHPSRKHDFDDLIDLCRTTYADYPVIWRKGKKVFEIRPKLNWGKGDAVRMIKTRIPHTLMITMGDDVTDEDMFRAMGRTGVSIRIGFKRGSHAKYFLKSTKAAENFLKVMSDSLRLNKV